MRPVSAARASPLKRRTSTFSSSTTRACSTSASSTRRTATPSCGIGSCDPSSAGGCSPTSLSVSLIFLISRALDRNEIEDAEIQPAEAHCVSQYFYREHMLQCAITACPAGGPSGVAGAHAAQQLWQSRGVAAQRKARHPGLLRSYTCQENAGCTCPCRPGQGPVAE